MYNAIKTLTEKIEKFYYDERGNGKDNGYEKIVRKPSKLETCCGFGCLVVVVAVLFFGLVGPCVRSAYGNQNKDYKPITETNISYINSLQHR